MKKYRILVTNDDGIDAPGIRKLIEIAKDYGNVTVVAPDSPRSGQGHAITMNIPLRLEELYRQNGHAEYKCSGTPVDCVKLAEKAILKGNADLVLSGINHGSNASINIIYSGTLAAVLEAAIEGVPAIGFSLLNWANNANFDNGEQFVRQIIENVLEEGLPQHVGLNVNIPDIPKNEIKGIKVCRQAKAYWDEEFDLRQDPHKRDYYWLTGVFKNLDEHNDTDEWALKHGYVSVVPVQADFTAHNSLHLLKKWESNAK